MKREAAFIRWWRRATAVKTRPGEKGLELFVGSAKQMVQVPAGKRLLWALCLSNMWTQYKKGREVGARGGAAASEGPRGPGLSAATLALPKNVCNPQADWDDPVALPGNAAGFPIVSNAQRGQGGSQREERGEAEGAQGRWCPFFSLMRAPSPLSENYNCTFLIFCALLLTVVID